MGEYLRATGRSGIADYADSFKANLQADNNVKYDEVIEVSHPSIQTPIHIRKIQSENSLTIVL
jgi:aconitate hydratase